MTLATLAALALVGPPPTLPDTEPGAPPPPNVAAASFKLPPGFELSVFAAEPDVLNPIAMSWDKRGRLWVAENFTYAERAQRFDWSLSDRVVIFEDGDGDGRSDRRKVFVDNVQALTSVEVGRGGAFLMCPPRVLFVPDADGDDVPDRAPEVVLDGFTVPGENHHNFANGLRWGPDGWLYGRCGASAPAMVGPPGTPEAQRVPIHGGLWRYSPATKRVESIAQGTTNPWGHDWDERGEAFFINTVNGHLWHAIPGAHFVRPHTIDPCPRVYELIDQHADHFHWDASKEWSDSRNATAEHDRRGGGHAHSGLMIYQGDQWPTEDRGKAFALNFHGRRTNVERLERLGAGTVGKHEPDRFFVGDPWFRGIDLGQGPDGGVFVLDWSDSGECHEHNGVHRNSGRIYKITYGKAKPAGPIDLGKLGPDELVARHRHANDWHVRQARLELSGRGPDERAKAAVGLRALFDEGPTYRLRAFWTLFVLGSADVDWLESLLRHDDETVRGWAVRFLTDGSSIDTARGARPFGPDKKCLSPLLDEFVRMGREDPSPHVRLVLASTLQRLPLSQREPLAAALMGRSEDAKDHDVPLMLWHGVMPLGETDRPALARLAIGCALPTTRRLIVRRLAEASRTDMAPLDLVLEKAPAPETLAGLAEGLKGLRKAPRPPSWDALAKRLAKDEGLRERVRELSLVFGDGRALDEVRRVALDDKADLATRRSAVEALIEARPEDLRTICEKLLKVRFLNATAARGLATFDDPSIGKALAENYRSFHPSERGQVLSALTTRASFARALLDQVAAGKVPKTDVTAFHARQMRGLGDADLAKRLAEVWGDSRESGAERKALIASWRSKLGPEALAKGDKSRGRAIFAKACGTCHKLFGQGGDIGPDLTGAGRHELDYLLENVIDPSAVVTADFRMTTLVMADGRVLNGIVKSRNDNVIGLQTQDRLLSLPREEIEQESPSTESLMPEGALGPLSQEEALGLFAYLSSPTQVAAPGP